MLTGENGILTQAQNAKEETEEARIEEKNTLTAYEDYINNATNDTAVVGEIVQNGNKQYSNHGTAIIPEGFMIVPGRNDVSQGLVISDNPEDTEEDSSNIVAKGNQFVWIPVTSENEYVRNTTYENKDVSATAYTDSGYLPDGIAPTIPDDITDEKEIGLLNEKAERNAVVSKGGFYISRYEAGNDGTDKLISKKNVTVWNSLSQENCKIEAKKFMNNENIKSALCSGIQWDIVMNVINGKIDGNSETFYVSEYNPNRHFIDTKPTNSGQNISDLVYNIYDLEGNCYEYVAEKYNNSDIVLRGGCFISTSTAPASNRRLDDGAGPSDTFRFVLYVM